mmetsp:Transcript_4768/g.14072  ORF Transcript_4768/g.14072 Transcript_4768/m.14072 type:complete len:221 (-) Transcript_4768:3016-3678(-)
MPAVQQKQTLQVADGTGQRPQGGVVDREVLEIREAGSHQLRKLPAERPSRTDGRRVVHALEGEGAEFVQVQVGRGKFACGAHILHDEAPQAQQLAHVIRERLQAADVDLKVIHPALLFERVVFADLRIQLGAEVGERRLLCEPIGESRAIVLREASARTQHAISELAIGVSLGGRLFRGDCEHHKGGAQIQEVLDGQVFELIVVHPQVREALEMIYAGGH